MKLVLVSVLWLPLAILAADINALPALAPADGELPPTFWELHHTFIIVASFAFLAFGFLFVKSMLRPANPEILPPETMARQALTQLLSEPEDGRVLSAVSQILRRYLGEAFSLPNHELTTAEFCAAIEARPQIGAELADTISGFLRECDVRKFSPAKSVAPFNAASRALQVVEQIEKRRLQPAVQAAATK